MSTQPLDHYFDALRTEALLPERTLDELTARAARGEIVVPAIPSVAAASVFSVPVISVMIVTVAALVAMGIMVMPDDDAPSVATTAPARSTTQSGATPGGEMVENVDTSMRRLAHGTSDKDSAVRTGGTRSASSPPARHAAPKRPGTRPGIMNHGVVTSTSTSTYPPLADTDFSSHVDPKLEETLPSVRNLHEETKDLTWERIDGYDVRPLDEINTEGDDLNIIGVGPSYYFLSDVPHEVKSSETWSPMPRTKPKGMRGTTNPDIARARFTPSGSLAATINAAGTSIEGITTTPGGFILILAVAGRGGPDSNVDLYEAERVGGEWKNLTPLPAVNTSYVETEPTLSADGDTLFFISNRPGGPGVDDANIWMSARSPGGDWGAPVILPTPINTPMREASPLYSSETGTLTYSSDGGWGHGGLDVFRSSRTADGGWTTPRNLGSPVSSHTDDRACLFLGGNDTILFASRRNDLGTFGGRYDLFVAVRSR